jgi:energy-coupling factor transporter ATP-binding protein EcfA2
MNRARADYLERTRRLDRLLIVAGPHGSGKTTLLNQLAAGTLPPDLAAVFPAGAKEWVQTSGRKVYPSPDGGRGQGASGGEGLILHYNIMRPQVGRAASYEADWVLGAIDRAGEVTVLTLRPPTALLIRRFAERTVVEQSEAPLLTRARRRARYLVSALARRVLPPGLLEKLPVGTPDRDAASLGGRYAYLMKMYAQPGWLEACYDRWETFLDALIARGCPVRKFEVEPAERNGARSFRFLSAAGD